MAEAQTNGIKVTTPFGPIVATGSAAIIGLLIVVLLGFLYFELDKLEDQFTLTRDHIDVRFKQIEDVQSYNACLSRLALWQYQRPRGEPLDWDALPREFYFCLPKFLSDRVK